jgi:hypothetical protein
MITTASIPHLETPPVPAFRHKALAALLASLGGALGLDRLYLRQRLWWLPLGVTALTLPLLVGVRNWYQSPAFFVLMIPVVAGFLRALILALMPDERFDARFNAGSARRNRSGWAAVLVAVFTLAGGAIALMATLALLFQTYYESVLRGG